MQNQYGVQQLNAYSQKLVYGSSQQSMLNEAIQHLPFRLPQPISILEQGVNSIPPYMRSPNLYKQIFSYNKKLIYSQFELLCEKVTQTYGQAKGTNTYINVSQFQSRLYTVINNQFPNGQYLTSQLNKNINQLKGNENQVEFVKNILYILGFSHASFYNLSIKQGNIGKQGFYMNNTNPFQDMLPDKYIRIIEEQLSILAKPVQANFFQNLIMNTLQGNNQHQSFQNLKTQAQIQAERAADALKKLFTSKYIQQNQTKQVQNKQNMQVPTCSVIQKMIKNQVQVNRGSIRYPNLPNYSNNNNQQQNILITLAESIQNQQLYNNKQSDPTRKNQRKQLQFDQWFNDNYVKMTYYQSYMMAHMANLIFLTPDKFDITLINYHPYISQLNEQINQQIINLKSELMAYRILFQSNMNLKNQNPFHNLLQNESPYQNPYPNQYQPNQFPQQINPQNQTFDETRSYGSNSNKTKKQNSLLDKAAGFFKNICVSAKQQASFSKRNVQKVTTKQPKLSQNFDQMKQSQKLFISQNFPYVESYYNRMIQILEQASSYFQRFQKEQPKISPTSPNLKKQQGVLKKLFNKAESIKEELTGQNLKYYHEVQSWMAIVMLLYRQVGFNKLDGYNYSSLKRRTIIKICKRIFIQQRKKDNKKSQGKKSKINHSFRNWPLVLKFLQNSRPEIMSDPLGGANEKQVDRILEDFYSVMRQKRMVGSSFGRMFEGLPPLKQTLPQIRLVCLSSGTNPTENLNKSKLTSQCKVVHLLISGFLSQDTDKLQEWADMVDLMPDSEVYALVWQSTTIKGLVKFFLKSAVDIVGAMKMIDEIRRKYVDNPFNPAFQVAQITGRILAELVVRLFPNRFVNVCGYSLGSEVIKQFLQGIINRKKTQILNNIYLMGGVSDAQGFGDLISRSQTPLSVYNCYTMNDSVLKNLLSLCKPDIKPIGLNQIRKIGGHSVINVDCTKIISGHLAFRSNLSLMGELLEVSTG